MSKAETRTVVGLYSHRLALYSKPLLLKHGARRTVPPYLALRRAQLSGGLHSVWKRIGSPQFCQIVSFGKARLRSLPVAPAWTTSP